MTLYVLANCELFDGVNEATEGGMHVAVEGDRIREVSDRPIALDGAILQWHGGLLAEHAVACDLQCFRGVQVRRWVAPTQVEDALRDGDE